MIKSWFTGLAEREQWMVAGGAAVAVAIVFWGLVWLPLTNATSERQETVGAQKTLLVKLAQIGPQTQAPSSRRGSNQSLVVLVDQTTRATGLAPALRRNQPDGNDTIRVTLQNAAFDSVMEWLANLESQHGVVVQSASVDTTRSPGTVNSTLVLTRS